jgi:flagellar biosynthetic protein FlhB
MSESADRESKTEEATEKRLQDAIAKGRQAFTREVPLLLSAIAVWIVIGLMMADASGQVGLVLRVFWERPAEFSMASSSDVTNLLGYIVIAVLLPILPAIGLICIAGMLGSLAQSRGFSAERIKPQMSRISPVAGFRRLFGKDGLGHTLKSTVGLILVGAVAAMVMLGLLRVSTAYVDLDPAYLAVSLSTLASRLLGAMLVAMTVVASVDLLLTRLAWRRGLRMTKQEVKEEAKEVDGDPQIKLRMRMLARRRMRKRMLAAVPRATVVITNPTHYAVALRYVSGETAAPIVVAKGTDLVALRIREIAASCRIPIVEDQPLARALHASVEVDAPIPPALYQAVARIVLFVDRTAARASAGS